MENLSLNDSPADTSAAETNGGEQQQTADTPSDAPQTEPTDTTTTETTTTTNNVSPQPAQQTENLAQPEPKKVESTAADAAEKSTKIDVLLKAAGDAPIMKKKKWAVDGNKPVAYLTQFIKKYIKCEPHEGLFLYVNQTFCPSQDQVLSNLFECFGSDGKLILHYCKAQAWG